MIKNIKFFTKLDSYLKELEVSGLYKQLKGAYENYKRSNSNLWANTLCYFTILTFIPIIAIAFSIGRWFGIDQYFFKQLSESSPLNEQTLNTILKTAQVLLKNTQNGIIAGVGFISLGWVVISMFSIIEKALNSIWGVKKTRSFFRKFSDYFTVFLILPIGVVLTNILINLKINIPIIHSIIETVAPYFSLWIFFLVFFSVLPNTKVNIIPTIWSSFIVSFLLNQSNVILLKLQLLISEYNKIYGSFSVLLLSLIWLKIVWFLILLGAHFTYIVQNRGNLIKIDGLKNLNFNSKYDILQVILLLFVKNFIKNESPLYIKAISKEIKLPYEVIEDTIENMEKLNYVVEVVTETEEKAYKISVNILELKYSEVYEELKNLGENYFVSTEKYDENISLYEVFKKFD
ncbi:YihY/virulence factor BrkB family protein [uncultured Cetobacterium sp.]|uniref:YihY/virulence factor BrkB family protein n=2 Tax=uncultured Cetobacterium sp. TaxID=527638 RepID=UPI00262658CF|nr:YihY/virulence factor BrkB family protein [uncultured Cetobacterium sp.]